MFTLTINKDSFKSKAMLNYFIKYSDLVLDFKSFSDSSEKFLDYQGSIQILKQPTINGLIGHKADHDIYVFKSDKRKFAIDVIHMDPEDGQSAPTDTTKSTKEESGKKKPGDATIALCSSKPSDKNPLDF